MLFFTIRFWFLSRSSRAEVLSLSLTFSSSVGSSSRSPSYFKRSSFSSTRARASSNDSVDSSVLCCERNDATCELLASIFFFNPTTTVTLALVCSSSGSLIFFWFIGYNFAFPYSFRTIFLVPPTHSTHMHPLRSAPK